MPDVILGDNHIYTVDGVKIVSVTQVIGKAFDQYFYFRNNRHLEENLERARQRGSDVHRIRHFYDAGQPIIPEDPTKKYSQDSLKYLNQWVDFKKKTGLKIIHSELRVFSKLYRYAGTLDIIADIFGHRAVIDIKTGLEDVTMHLQTAPYQQAYNETHLKRPAVKRYVLVLNGKGFPKLIEHKDKSDMSVFLAAKKITEFKVRHNLI